jgi:hypothetical protein
MQHSNNARSLTAFMGVALLAAGIGLGLKFVPHAPLAPDAAVQPQGSQAESAEASASQQLQAQEPGAQVAAPVPQRQEAVQPPARPATAAVRPAQPADLTPLVRQLFPSLTNLDLSQGLTKEQAAQFQQGFQALAAQGAPAVAGIGEFLHKNLDWVFGGETAESAGAASLRAGLLDSLRQIGGPEALALSREVLQNTTDPLEIALLSRNLEEAAPGQYTQEAVDAARQALSTLAQDHVTNLDAAPLFQVLQTYGGTAAAADLAKAAPEWNYYGPIALAELPSGQGIPALIQLAQDPAGLETGNNKFALQMLAQVASKYPDAAAALVDLAGHNQITDGTWLSIGGGLSGDQYQFARQFPQNTPAVAPGSPATISTSAGGNQTFYGVPLGSDGSAPDLSQRLAVIDQLLAAGANNPAAVSALRQARARLAGGVAAR